LKYWCIFTKRPLLLQARSNQQHFYINFEERLTVDYKIAFLGFGNVGKALASLLLVKQDELKKDYGIGFSVTGIITGQHGILIDPKGVDLKQALITLEGFGENVPKNLAQEIGSTEEMDAFEFIHSCGADVIFELTPVNYENGQPAVDYIRSALNEGMHVVTANKGPLVHAYHDLTQLAMENGVHFYFESCVMDGAPIFSLFRETLPLAKVKGLHGVLNSTTNLILTYMEKGVHFDQALNYAQKIGIAETDPSGDIDGWDAAVKVAALVTVLMDYPLKPQEVERDGIRHLTLNDIARAEQQDMRWKLVCSARWDGEVVVARVAPELVDMDSPLFHVEGTSSVVQFETDVLGQLTILEEDPGPETTAYGCLADFINAVRR